MATSVNTSQVWLTAQSPRFVTPTVAINISGNVSGTVNNVPVVTVTTGAANGSTAYSGTANYRTDTAPTNAVVAASSPTLVSNSDGSRDITLSWSYTDGAVPADGFILFYREGTGTVLSTDSGIQLPATARSYRFQGVHQGTAYRAGIAAFRRTEAGLRITSIYQPISTPDWRVSAATTNITANINGVGASTLTSQAAAGSAIQQQLEANGSTILTGQLMPTNTGGIKVGTITWNSTTGALTGGTGIAITVYGIIGAAAGVATFTFNALTGAATFKGDITGGANIDITGTAVFNGNNTDGLVITAILANSNRGQANGIRAYSGSTGGNGVYGNADNASGTGYGGYFRRQNGTRGAALIAESSTSATAAIFNNTSTGKAIEALGDVDISGLMQCNSLRIDQSPATGYATAAFPGNNKPGSDSSNTWVSISLNATTYYIPAWT